MHSSEERLREFSEVSSDVLWIRRASDLQWEYLSPALHKIYGISRQDALRGNNLTGWGDLILPEDRESALANIEKVRQGERVAFEYRVRRPEDGQIRWLRNTDFPMRDESGRVVRIGGIGHDLTEVKQAEEHQKYLLGELQHRVRNTLAVIRSIARRTAQNSRSVEEYSSHLDGRIDAFARVQAAVTRNPLRGVDLATLVAEELRAAAAREGEQYEMDGPDVWLNAKGAENLALAIHELATNAIKHGALSIPKGRIDIRWRREDDALVLIWSESGLNDLPPVPSRKGLGTETITRSLPYQLGAQATLDFLPTGIACRLVVPMSRIASRS